MKPAEIYKSRLNRGHFRELFTDYIEDGAAVGRDGVRVESFHDHIDTEIDVILRKIRAGTYEFTAYREKLISKGAGKHPRQISIPTIRDKLVLKFVSELLATIFPDHVSQPPHQFIRRIHNSSKSRSPTDFYLRLDIQSYFPTINHQIMMRILRRTIRQKQLLRLIENAITTPTGLKKNQYSLSKKGVPQGLSISNILSSLYLSDIDAQFGGLLDVEYFRFVDDVLIIADHPTVLDLANKVPAALKSKRKIVCHEVGEGSKSMLVSLAEGIDYLGYHFCLSKIQVREPSFKKMFANLMKLFTAMKYKENKGPLIWRMNLRISGCLFENRKIGWTFYFSQSNNYQQLKHLDAFVASQARRVLAPADCARLKTFTRAYHEIRFNRRDSMYFPNFDNFDDAQKKAQIGLLMPRKTLAELDSMTSKELDKLFRRCISKEIGELERDMMEVFS